MAGGSVSSSAEIMTRTLLFPQSLGSEQTKRNSRKWTMKDKQQREPQLNQEGQLGECLTSLGAFAGKSFPNRLSSRLHVRHQFHCGGLASISQASTSCLHGTSIVTLLRQGEAMDSATLYSPSTPILSCCICSSLDNAIKDYRDGQRRE